MTDHDVAPGRIGRPPKVDADGIPTRDRLLRAAVDACVECGYEGATLADIARRAEVSTPAVYGHFSGKAALLVEASKRELDAISNTRLAGEAGIREIARLWLRPDFARTRVLVAELHCAAIRQPEVAELLAAWQHENARRLERLAGLSPDQVNMYYLLLLGLSHTDQVSGLGVTEHQIGAQVDALIDGWFAASARQADC
ncbi:MAG TPA: TetR/AcrR family transcriptional regulator [Ilumatobacteraceae bacterium]|nr:TetR/AcrR family transcriptional regulator [Ilumatobacteraceae bacterium]